MNTVHYDSIIDQPLIAHDTEITIEHIKVEPDGMEFSEEQPLVHQPHDIEFVSEKIKLEKQDTEEFDVIEDQPLALRIHNTNCSKNQALKENKSLNKRYETRNKRNYNLISEQPLIAHEKNLAIEHIKVEPDGIEFSEEQPLAHQPHDIEFVSEKIKLEKQDTEEIDVIEDQPLALRIHNTHVSKKQAHKQSKSQNKRYAIYKCSFCGRRCSTKHLLSAHKKTHTVDKPFKCADCEKCFHYSKHLETHIKLLCIGPSINKSSNKKKLFQQNKNKWKKYKTAYCPSLNPFKCAKCSRCFSRRYVLHKHVKTICKPASDHGKIKPFKCAGCAMRYAVIGHLEQHLATLCKKQSVRILNTNHPSNDPSASNTWVIDAGDRPYLCSGCGISYDRPLYLKKHVKSCKKVQNEANPVKLNMLNPIQNEVDPIHLNMLNPINLNIGGPNPNNSPECAGCGKSFPTRKNMLRHVQRHTAKTKPFQCANCGQCFSQKCTLKKHKKTHIVEKAHKCNRCEKSFVHANKLFIHMSIHTEEETEENPYTCNECGIHFSHSNILETHMRTHFGQNNPYYLEQHEFEQDVSNSTYLYNNSYNSEQHYFGHDEPSGQPLEVLNNEEKPVTVNIKSEQDEIEEIDICEEDPIDNLTARTKLPTVNIKSEQDDIEEIDISEEDPIDNLTVETEDIKLEQVNLGHYELVEQPLGMLEYENKPFSANFKSDQENSEEYLLGD